MAKVTFTLEQQLVDQRSNETAYQLTIENHGQVAVNLLSLTPRVPEDVQVVEAKNPSVVAAKAQHTALCAELTRLVEYQLLIASKEFRERAAQAQREMLEEALRPRGFLLFYGSLFSRRAAASVKRIMERGRALAVQIRTKADAANAFARFFTNAQNVGAVREIYEAKLEQLTALEAKAGSDLESASIATIEPDSVFGMTYVFRFPRSRLDARKYNISIEGTYSEGGQPERYVKAASTSLVVSPYPWILSSVAVMASCLGVILKSAVTVTAAPTSSAVAAFNPLDMLVSPQTWAAGILALVFFNAFEYTSAGRQIGMPVGWRSALVIGCLCGVSGDRILAGLQAFLK